MLNTPVNPQDLDINFYESYPNQEFLAQRLEHWFTRYQPTTAQLQMALHKSQIKSLAAQRAFVTLIKPLKSVYDFARPLLNQQLHAQFDLDVDCRHVYLLEGVFTKTGADLHEQPVLLAALQNYPADKKFPLPTSLVYGASPYPLGVGGVITDHLEQVCGSKISCGTGLIDVAPDAFVRMCRALNLGEKYQAHVDSVLGDALNRLQIEDAFVLKERCRFEVLSHIARMKNDVSQPAYEALLEVAKADGKPLWRGGPVHYSMPALFATQGSSGFELCGLLMIEPGASKNTTSANTPLIVYMPGEPRHPLKEYASVNAFLDYLRVSLTDPTYRRYFERFISLSQYSAFFAKLNATLMPRGSFDPGAKLFLSTKEHSQPFQMLCTQAFAKLRSDAKVLAVPVKSRVTRSVADALQALRPIAHFLFDLADVFLPASQTRDLIRDVFIAAENWLDGDSEKALNQLYELGKDAVLAAAPQVVHEYERLERIYEDGKQAVEALIDELRGAANSGMDSQPIGTGSASDEITELEHGVPDQVRNMTKPSAFIEGLAQVKTAGGQTRLWKQDLTAFAQPNALPNGAALDARSLFKAGGKTWLAMGGHCYVVGFDSTLNKWRLLDPQGRQAYSPILENNGAGAWRVEGDDPMGWDVYKAFRRLHGDCVSLADSAINQILRITQADEAVLRQIHVDKLVPPALLIDCTQRFLIAQEVSHFIDLMTRLSGPDSGDAVDPWVVSGIEPYLDFIVTLPGWPEQRVLRRIDAQGKVLSRHASVSNASRNVDVIYTQGDMKALLDRLLAGLSPLEVESLLVNFHPSRSPAQHLASRLAAEANGRRKDLFELLYAIKYRSTAPLVTLLQRDFPSLPYCVAEEIISFADRTEMDRMSNLRRIPLRLAEHAREYLQQLRINRTLECFYLHLESADSDRVSLELINAIPDWPQNLVIEVRQNSFGGNTVYRLGNKDSLAVEVEVDVDVVLVQTGNSYQTFNGQGQRTYFDTPRLRSTLSNALGAQERLARDVNDLEEVLGDLGTVQRSKVKRALGLQDIKPGIKWPSRSSNGRLGYRMSGRLRGLFNRFKGNASAFSPELAVKRLYPQFTGRQIKAFLDALTATFVGTPKQKKERVKNRLHELAQEYATLESTLDSWVAEARYAEPEPLPGASADGREVARMRIVSCWRREHESLIDPDSPDSAHKLKLDNLALGVLPVITADFHHVQALILDNLALGTGAVDTFVRSFPQLRLLSLGRNLMDAVPEGLGQLPSLKSLVLSRNPIRVDAQGMQVLQRLIALEKLSIEGEGIDIAMPINVTDWPELSEFKLRSCGLTTVPGGLRDNTRLRHIDLRHNRITDISEQTLSDIAWRLDLRVQLFQNPLNAQTVARAANIFDPVALLRMGIGELPQAQTIAQWLAETGGDQQRQRWANLQREASGDAFVQLVNDLLSTADYRDNRHLLTARLWRMIDAMAESDALQDELFTLAAHPETCGDGSMILFNMLDVRVLVSQLESSSGGRDPTDMFKLMRGLERLDELEKIALEDFNARVAAHPSLDQVEVRLIYPTRLRDELALPGQSQDMLFGNLSGVDESRLYNAKVRVLEREKTPAFFVSMVARKDWLTFLEDHYKGRFDRVRLPFHDRQDLLDAHQDEMTDDAYLRGCNTLLAELKQAVETLALQLTKDIALLASTPD